MAELKPCPFYGSKAISVKMVYGDGNTYYAITCEDWRCAASSIVPNYGEEQYAIEAWNRRAKDDDQTKA